MEWVKNHTDMLGLIVNAAMLVVWIVYLSIFLFSYLRQRRPCILITQGAGAGLSAKCFISNLGLEPIYVLDVLLTLKTEDQQHLVNVTERSQLTDREQANPKEATNQGPLSTGDHESIGEVGVLLDRALSGAPENVTIDRVRVVEVTVVAATAARGLLVGARRSYELVGEEDERRLKPTTVMAEQITRRRSRRSLREDLQKRLEIAD